jgi:hypothetical protein
MEESRRFFWSGVTIRWILAQIMYRRGCPRAVFGKWVSVNHPAPLRCLWPAARGWCL